MLQRSIMTALAVRRWIVPNAAAIDPPPIVPRTIVGIGLAATKDVVGLV
jgi:hypothetical protein